MSKRACRKLGWFVSTRPSINAIFVCAEPCACSHKRRSPARRTQRAASSPRRAGICGRESTAPRSVDETETSCELLTSLLSGTPAGGCGDTLRLQTQGRKLRHESALRYSRRSRHRPHVAVRAALAPDAPAGSARLRGRKYEADRNRDENARRGGATTGGFQRALP